MAIVIDPRVRILEDDHQVFVLHPGRAKKFYEDFSRTKSAFLDLPGAKFDAIPDIEDDDVRSVIRMSNAIRGWYNKKKPKDKKPSENPNDYRAKTPGLPPSHTANAAHHLYTDAKPGDLLVVPGLGYHSPVLLAEFADEFDPDYLVDAGRYDLHKLPARRIKFLSFYKKKYEFSSRLVQLMQNRQALIKISELHDRREIYLEAYRTFAWKESSGSTIRITNDVVDLNDLNQAIALTNYIGAMYLAKEAGQLENFVDLGFYDAIDKFYNREMFGNASIEIHSPGFFNRPLKDKAMAGFISAMLLLASESVSAEDAQRVEIQNSANPAENFCDMKLKDDIRAAMIIMANTPLWETEICGRLKKISEEINLETDAKIKRN